MIRIGLIADIHGNAWALDQVLTRLDRSSVDEVVCLGDVAVLGPEPNRTIITLRERDILTVCGNTDAWAVDGHTIPVNAADSASSRAFTAWTRTTISKTNRAWIASLPLMIEREIHGRKLCFCHGSPASPDDIIQNLEASRIGEFGYGILIGGHTHQQVRQSIGNVLYINPGSAGLPGVGPGDRVPIHERPNWVEFAILDMTESKVNVEMIRIPVDVDQMIDSAERSGMPKQMWWRSLWA